MFAKIYGGRRALDKGVRALTALALIGLTLAASAPRANAAAYNYGTRTRTINAGVLVVDDLGPNPSQPSSSNYDPATGGFTTTADDPDPYVFYILNQRPDVEPNGWNIVNPLAPHTVTGDILSRWDNRTSNDGNGNPIVYQLNQPITPSMAAYWEVLLSKTTLQSLEQFDVLLLPVQNHTVSLSDNEIQELRRYVDNGGQLWIEDTGGGAFQAAPSTYNATGTPYYGPLFFDANFNSVTAGSFVLPAVNGLLIHHPIIAAPYLLTDAELSSLGNAAGDAQYVSGNASSTAPPDLSFVATVLNVQSGGGATYPAISAGQYGAGEIVIDAVGAADAINSAVSGIPNTVTNDTNAGPYCGNNFAAAPAADLKFASDIISWTSAHPNEHKNSHQSSQSANTLGPALSATWTYKTPTPPAQTSLATPGAAINGNLVYVRTSDGYLRCFNATPGTDVLGTGFVDAGFQDYSSGTPWDEVWDTMPNGFKGTTVLTFNDPYASAPMVASVPISTSATDTAVFVEGADGTVYAADATTGAPLAFGGGAAGKMPKSGASSSQNNNAYGPTTFAPAPSPVYYDGRLYAAEPDGSLYEYDFREASANRFVVATQTQNPPEYPIASPAVGLVNETLGSTSGTNYANDIVVSLTTNYATYTLHAGARHDPLNGTGVTGTDYTPAPANSALPFDIDAGNVPPDENYAYSDSPPGATAPSGYQDVIGALTAAGLQANGNLPPPPYFGDYDVDFSASPTGSLTRAEFYGSMTGGAPGATLATSAPALDSNGNFYYTTRSTGPAVQTDSTIVCAHDVRLNTEFDSSGTSHERMIWRFRLPFVGEAIADADGVNYTPLEGFQFVGTPVVDTQGNVFALAANPTTGLAAVLCFNATQPVTIQMPVNNSGGVVNITSLSQPVNATGIPASATATEDEFGNSPAQPVMSGGFQFTNHVDVNGRATIQSFGGPPSGGGLMTYPNLSEPQPVSATYVVNSANGSTAQTVTAPLHTNLIWYGILPTAIALNGNAGLTLIGNYLFFGDANGNVQVVPAYPQSSGGVTNGVVLAPNLFTFPAKVGSINGVASAGNGVLVVNGSLGVAAFGTRYSLVSDATRVMEVDSLGNPSWLVDATSETTPTGTTTHVELNHPTDVTQITSNDYLVADTGNNRCVRFDRSGNVLWELSRFNDTGLVDGTGTPITFYTSAAGSPATKTAPLLAPGEPTTLNHPTSVTSYVQNVFSGTTFVGTLTHYLIADTGNNRVVEVVDAFDKNGRPVGTPHDLVWVSHTYDAEGRPYAYTSANYFTGPDGNSYVAALVTNKRVAQLSPAQVQLAAQPRGQLGSAAADANGSTILLLDYDPSNSVATQANGYVHVSGTANGWHLSAISTFLGYFNANGTFDLADAPKYTTTSAGQPQAATAAPRVLYLRNPRFLQTYTPPGAQSNAVQNFLLADDDGVFDLYLDPNGATSGGNATQYAQNLEALWGFTQGDYQLLEQQSINGTSVTYPFATIPGLLNANGTAPATRTPVVNQANSIIGPGVPFVPNSLVRSTTDTVNVGGTNGTNYLIGHYYVTNGYSQGEVTPISGFGGEALELEALDGPNGLGTFYASSFGNFGSLSYNMQTNTYAPTGANQTSPLSDPTYAGPEK